MQENGGDCPQVVDIPFGQSKVLQNTHKKTKWIKKRNEKHKQITFLLLIMVKISEF